LFSSQQSSNRGDEVSVIVTVRCWLSRSVQRRTVPPADEKSRARFKQACSVQSSTRGLAPKMSTAMSAYAMSQKARCSSEPVMVSSKSIPRQAPGVVTWDVKTMGAPAVPEGPVDREAYCATGIQEGERRASVCGDVIAGRDHDGVVEFVAAAAAGDDAGRVGDQIIEGPVHAQSGGHVGSLRTGGHQDEGENGGEETSTPHGAPP
jgi:hypothetical protein